MNPLFHTDLSISDSLKSVRKSVLIYETIILNMGAKYETDDGQMPYADLHGDDVPEEIRILSLTDILDYLTKHGDFNYIIEVKNGGELGMQSVDILYAELRERDMLDKVIFGSFNGEVSDYEIGRASCRERV